MKHSELGIPADDWLALKSARPNVLLVGPEVDTSRVVNALLPLMQKPVAWRTGRPFALPEPGAETLVLQNAADLDGASQGELLRWLQHDARPSLQILTTTPVSLLPRVDQGLFLDALYYRLNVMCVFVGV